MTSPDESKRVPLRIRLPFSTESEFVDKYGVHLAPGGIFITTRSSKPEGTLLSLEVVLTDGSRVMRGEGVVERVVEDEQPGKSGMLVRFTRIDARTKALLDLVTAARAGVTPEPPATGPSQPEPPAPAPYRSSPTPGPFSSKGKPPLSEDLVLGIDLGTTTCRVALVQDGAPRLLTIPSERGVAMPSAVALDTAKARLLVGSAARKHRVEHPEQTIVGFKRLMGRRARSKKVREIAGRVAFSIVADMEGDAGVELGERTYALPEFAAMLLRELKNAAQEHLHREVYRAVLCVPAWYTDHQRASVLEAGRLAGLEILSLLNEPSAVALAFGYGRGLARKRVLVYDLGGGTFDASVVEITGDDIEVVSTGGDVFLGGLDFDSRLADALIGTLAESVRDRLLESRITVERVRDAAELAKITLSEKTETPVRVPFITHDDSGKPVDLTVTVERSFLEANTQDLVERTVEVTQVVLDAAKLTPQHLDEVVLVGGQSRAPAIRARLEQVLGRPGRNDVDPQGAVALGAALYGHSLVQKERGKKGLRLAEVLAAPIGVAVRGGGVRRVLERNTRLPAGKTLAVPVEAGQTMGLAVVQGAAPLAVDNEYLGALHATFDRSGEASLRFSLSTDGRLTVSATSPTGKETQLTFATPDASEAVHAELLAQSPLPGEVGPVTSSKSGLFGGIKKLFGR
ncbi:MAG: TIGR02266 family protein [Myxococcales bacterium]|nr:TIGR02266 family protein [Myxococcales bacterium]